MRIDASCSLCGYGIWVSGESGRPFLRPSLSSHLQQAHGRKQPAAWDEAEEMLTRGTADAGRQKPQETVSIPDAPIGRPEPTKGRRKPATARKGV